MGRIACTSPARRPQLQMARSVASSFLMVTALTEFPRLPGSRDRCSTYCCKCVWDIETTGSLAGKIRCRCLRWISIVQSVLASSESRAIFYDKICKSHRCLECRLFVYATIRQEECRHISGVRNFQPPPFDQSNAFLDTLYRRVRFVVVIRFHCPTELTSTEPENDTVTPAT